MNEREERGSFAFMLQILILLAVFLGVCAVLTQTFAGAEHLSRKAAGQNAGIELCRNAAEAFAVSGSLEKTVTLLGGDKPDGETATIRFNEDLTATPDGCYTLTITATSQSKSAGTLVQAHLAVTDAEGTLCAELDTERYLPDTQGGAGYAA